MPTLSAHSDKRYSPLAEKHAAIKRMQQPAMSPEPLTAFGKPNIPAPMIVLDRFAMHAIIFEFPLYFIPFFMAELDNGADAN